MGNGSLRFKDNSGNVVSFISGSGSDIIISGGTLNLLGMTEVTLGNVTISGTTISNENYLSTSSFNTYSGTTNTIIGSLQTSTGSLNSFTSSAINRFNSIENKTGSFATTGSNTFNGNLTVTGYIDAQELRTTFISSSILYRSGSTKFGDELTDTHNFTGSLSVSGSVILSTISSGSTETNILLVNNTGNIVYRNDLSLTGAQGFQGNQGPTGLQGDTGSQGNQGPTGLQGFNGTIGVNGEQGNQGPTGLQGDTGSQGNQGPTGLQGTTGSQGNQGPNGLQGTTGSQGNQGPTGAQGNQGPTGFQGDTGSQGNQGPTGLQGTTGSQGNQGPTGLQGTTGSQGNQGPTGLQGTTGSQGNQGPTGAQGNQGPTGAQGNQGPTGLQGTTGSQGNQGPTGLQGSTGASAGITSYTNPADNRILTSVNSTTINAESGLTYNGTTLIVGGGLNVSNDVFVGSISPNTSDYTRYVKTSDSGPNRVLTIGSVGSTGTYKGQIYFQTSYNTETPSVAMFIDELQNVSMYGTLGVTGIATFSTDVRSPIFYDSANTAYYLDPASTSNLNIITCTTLTETSTIKIKENIEEIQNPLELVKKLRGIKYNKIGNNNKEIGVIAEEVNNILSEVVIKDNEGQPSSVSYGRLTALLIEVVKKQDVQIENLTKRIEELENKNDIFIINQK